METFVTVGIELLIVGLCSYVLAKACDSFEGAADFIGRKMPPGIKGATATNQLKEATCETGLKTRVPPFIVSGEKIRVSTDDGSYLGRVKDD